MADDVLMGFRRKRDARMRAGAASDPSDHPPGKKCEGIATHSNIPLIDFK